MIARAPRPGHSKTRLCPPCTLEQAAGLAEAALKDTLEAVAATVVERRVLVLDDSPARWVPDGFEVIPRRNVDLGGRLTAGFWMRKRPALPSAWTPRR